MSVSFPHKVGPWTIDDLPDDDGRYEIVDGVLLVIPPATPRHAAAKRAIQLELARSVAPERVLQEAGLTFAQTSFRIPDVVVVREDFDPWHAPSLTPGDVVAVVEVVSPSSVTTDHLVKRAQYAADGIPAYWIVETDPGLRVTALSLPPGTDVYVEIGSWAAGETVRVDQPLPVSFEVDALQGRGQRPTGR